MGAVAEVTDNDFQSEVLQSEVPVLVDFWAPWCGPCRMIAPTIEELAQDNQGGAKVVKLNVDDSPGTAGQYNISSIPTLMIFKGGEPVERVAGVQTKDKLQALLDAAK